MKVPFLDLQAQYLEIKPEVDLKLSEFLEAGSYIGGEYLKNFEENFSSFLGANYCIGVANGLDALEISLKALGIGKGDEVIVPSNTFIATWLAVSNCGGILFLLSLNIAHSQLILVKLNLQLAKRLKL